jgi:hypothetical protein
VPDGIDFVSLRSYLESESRVRLFLPWEAAAYLSAGARAALLRVQYELDAPPRAVPRRLLDDRFAIASLLLAGLALYALRAAARPGVGALP